MHVFSRVESGSVKTKTLNRATTNNKTLGRFSHTQRKTQKINKFSCSEKCHTVLSFLSRISFSVLAYDVFTDNELYSKKQGY